MKVSTIITEYSQTTIPLKSLMILLPGLINFVLAVPKSLKQLAIKSRITKTKITMKKKMNLEGLKVKSFVTNMNDKISETIKGGATDQCFTYLTNCGTCNDLCQTWKTGCTVTQQQ